jgi:peptide/nickel transport system permease protein
LSDAGNPVISTDRVARNQLVKVRRERLALLRKNKAFIAGILLLGFWVICSIVGNLLTPHDPQQINLMATNLSPSGTNFFGTDSLGRDVFSRVIVGARPILFMATGATVIGTVLGTTIGLIAGYYKGIVDALIMRLVDALSAIPVIVLALLAVATLERPSNFLTLVIIGIVFTPIIARTVRAAVLGETELDYVAAARLRTEKVPYILAVEVLPNVLPPIIVEFTVRLGYAIFAIATLSFLGAGVQIGSPNWGSQVAEHYSKMYGGIWWSTMFPAGAIATLAIGVNLIADGLMEVFDL